MDMHLTIDDSPPLRPQGASFSQRNKSRHVTDTDSFYAELYLYYHSKGLANFVAKRCISLATTTFIVFFCSFVFSFVKWHDLLTCPDHTHDVYHTGTVTNGTEVVQCGPLSSYINWHAWKSPDGWHVMVIGNLVIMCLYWLWGLLSTIPLVWSAARVHNYLKNELKISTRRLQTMEWEDLLNVHGAYQQLGPLRGMTCLGEHLIPPPREPSLIDDPEARRGSVQARVKQWHARIAARIMRRDNYMIAIVRERVIPVSICGYKLPFSQSLYWLVQAIISGTPPDKIRAKQIRRSSISLGIFSLLLLPFAFIFLLTFFLIKHAEDFHVHRDYLGPRTWTLYARTLFRRYNELPHAFQNRLVGSYKPATEYIRQFYLPVEHTIAQFFSFVFSALLTVMAFVALFDESIMLHVTIGSRNLLFYLALFSFGIAAAHYFIPDPTILPYKPVEKMELLQKHIRHCPGEWRDRFETFDVRDKVMGLYQLRIKEFFYEIISAIFLPVILLWIIPVRADAISRFLRTHTLDDGEGQTMLSSSMDWDELKE